MVKLFSAAAGCLALASAVVAQTEYIFEEELGATYRSARIYSAFVWDAQIDLWCLLDMLCINQAIGQMRL